MSMSTPRRKGAAFAAAAAVVLASACSGGATPATAGSEQVKVVAAFYPLQYVSQQVGGDAVSVANLAPPGAEPHDLELTPAQVAHIAEADLVVYLKGFQPSVDESVKQNAAGKAFDVATVEPLHDAVETDEHDQAGHEQEMGGKDPHVWLDPVRLAAISDRLAERLASLDSGHAPQYIARAADLHGRLLALDRQYRDRLATCQRREIVVSHAAFGYLAERYRLKQVAITGLSPEDEPGPRKLAEVTAQAQQLGATTVFFETLVSPKLAQTIAQEVGAKAEVLDPIEGLQVGSPDDYLSVMRANLTRLVTALGCTG
ncbi:metal ABC transporter substrate-binding protein [Catellatospora tritici]|uniref:metal ABC transporter substrate-binding protein n=1 Tax=Catellatospora tritici TaxID=2851566 RepID=UPI001C2D4D30|nr:metal ABC transporter substrate-binding protein [Catellatospora tritici]MBV1856634.1 metal ABC transporter substrate-binding protein [Catellatospora tritici]